MNEKEEKNDEFYNDFHVEISEKNKKNKKSKNKYILIAIGVAIFIIILIILLILLTNTNTKDSSNNEEEEEEEYEIIGEINCIYNIMTVNTETQLVNEDYRKENNFGLYIDRNKIKYSKKYKFTNLGMHEVKFALYEDLKMENMFKGIQSLISVEMIGINETQILSINNAFEGCTHLTSFSISKFDTHRIKSFQKVFYNTNLKTFTSEDLNTTSVEDMSYFLLLQK